MIWVRFTWRISYRVLYSLVSPPSRAVTYNTVFMCSFRFFSFDLRQILIPSSAYIAGKTATGVSITGMRVIQQVVLTASYGLSPFQLFTNSFVTLYNCFSPWHAGMHSLPIDTYLLGCTCARPWLTILDVSTGTYLSQVRRGKPSSKFSSRLPTFSHHLKDVVQKI